MTMTNDILGKLIGNPNRVKLIRLFIFNPEKIIDRMSASVFSKIPNNKLGRELTLLESIGMIKARNIPAKERKSKARSGYQLAENFSLAPHFKYLLNADFLRRRDELVKRFKNCGRIKLLLISGIFIENTDSRIDLVIVGDTLKRPVIERIIHGIEAEVGRELAYSIFETEDFVYRVNTSDKFIRDVYDYPHERIIDKLPFN